MHFFAPPPATTDQKRDASQVHPPEALDAHAFRHVPGELTSAQLMQHGSSVPSLTSAFSVHAPHHAHSPASVYALPTAPRGTRPRALNVRERGLRQTYDLLQVSLLRRDAVRATRALKVLLHAHEFPQGQFFGEAMQLAGLLARQSAEAHEGGPDRATSEEGARAAAEGRLQYLKQLWLRNIRYVSLRQRFCERGHADKVCHISQRPRLLPDLIREHCVLGQYTEAQDELEG